MKVAGKEVTKAKLWVAAGISLKTAGVCDDETSATIRVREQLCCPRVYALYTVTLTRSWAMELRKSVCLSIVQYRANSSEH